MKKVVLILSILGLIGGSLWAHPLGFKICLYNGPKSDMESARDSFLLAQMAKIGVDLILDQYNNDLHEWCWRQDTLGIADIRCGATSYRWPPGFYDKGFTLVGRYVDWRLCADSMVLWDTLAYMFCDSMVNCDAYKNAFGTYRLVDWDSSYMWGHQVKYACDGAQRLYWILKYEKDDSLKFSNKTHYTWAWGIYNTPGSVEYYLDRMPDLDIFGGGAPIICHSNENSTQAKLNTLIENCRECVGPANARGKAYVPLIHPTREDGYCPTLEQIRAESWVSFAYGCPWVAYYVYRGYKLYTGQPDFDGVAGVIQSDHQPYITDHQPYITDDGLDALKDNYQDWDNNWNSAWSRNENENSYTDLFFVIDELDSIGPTLGNLTWIDGFSKTECPRGWIKDPSITGGDSADFGMFKHDANQEAYLMVVNRNTGENDEADISFDLYTGSGYFNVVNVAKDSIITSDSADAFGFLYSKVTVEDIPPGGGVLLHIDSDPDSGKVSSLNLSYTKATYGVNGRKIAIDKLGRIHVAYTDKSGDSLHVWYAYSDDNGSSWRKQRLPNYTHWPSITVDRSGVPYVASFEGQSYGYRVTLWTNGEYDSIGINVVGSRSPTITYEDGSGLIVTHFQEGNHIDGSCRYSPGLNKPLKVSVKPPAFSPTDGLSNCVRDTGDVVVFGRSTSASSHNELYARVEIELHEDYDYDTYREEGVHGNPSAGRQGDEVWIAYIVNTNNDSLFYKKTSPLSKPFKILDDPIPINVTPGNAACNVQIANNMPFVVWEDHSTSNGIKIYYSYMNKDGTWTTPDRVTDNASTITERYPHVAIDFESNVARIIWTQWGGGDTCIGIASPKPFDDSVRVLRPNGGETFILNSSSYVWWWQDGEPDSNIVEITYSYEGGSTQWEKVTSGHYDETDYGDHTALFLPNTVTDAGRARVRAFYGANEVNDISDANFIVTGLVIKPVYTPYDPGDNQICYLPPGSSNGTYWEALSCNGLSTIDLQSSKDGGESFMSISDSSTYDSTFTDTIIADSDTLLVYEYTGVTYWTAPATPTSDGCLKMMATDTTSDTAYSDTFFPFVIPPPGGFAYNTYSNQNMMSTNDDGDNIGLVYTAQDPDTATKVSVLYMESDEGLDFSAPDTIAEGCWPAFSAGACCWQTKTGDTLRYGYQSGDSFVVSTLHAIPQAYDEGQFTPVGILSENDTVHIVFRETDKFKDQSNRPSSSIEIIHLKFLESSPSPPLSIDTLRDSTVFNSLALYDSVKIAPHLEKGNSTIYAAYEFSGVCCLSMITSSSLVTAPIGSGSHPHLALSEGNLIYTYIGAGDTTLIRLWRYVDDTTWVERDTFYLDDDAEFLFGEQGLYYGVQYADTNLADIFVYDPISEEYYLNASYTGYYPHPYIDTGGEEFAWISAYADYVDTSTTYMHTERHDVNVILPALYLEADDKRSPYTVFRDTCIHYRSVDVDSGRDSLTYLFGNLNSSDDYSVIVEFYTECDSVTQLQVQVGTNLDTIQIPGNSYSWYEQDIASSSDTMALAIRRLSQFGFVPVSRVIVRRRSEAGFFMAMGGQQSDGPIVIPFCLYQPFPNPFGDAATIRYSLPYATHVSLKVYDVSGRMVTRLVDEQVDPGVHELRWEGKDNLNRKCASGVYFVRYQADEYQAAKKLVLIK